MKTIIIVWALLVACMCFVPPWQERIQTVNNRGGWDSGFYRMYGCAPLYNPPQMIKFEGGLLISSIDYRQLGIQIAGITVLAGGLLVGMMLTSPTRRATIFSAWKENTKVIAGIVGVLALVIVVGGILGLGLEGLIQHFPWIWWGLGALLGVGILCLGLVFIGYTIWTVLCYAVYRYRSRGLSGSRRQSFARFFSCSIANRGVSG